MGLKSILEAANGSSVSFDPQGGVILPRFNIPDEPSLPGKFNLATGFLFFTLLGVSITVARCREFGA